MVDHILKGKAAELENDLRIIEEVFTDDNIDSDKIKEKYKELNILNIDNNRISIKESILNEIKKTKDKSSPSVIYIDEYT